MTPEAGGVVSKCRNFANVLGCKRACWSGKGGRDWRSAQTAGGEESREGASVGCRRGQGGGMEGAAVPGPPPALRLASNAGSSGYHPHHFVLLLLYSKVYMYPTFSARTSCAPLRRGYRPLHSARR